MAYLQLLTYVWAGFDFKLQIESRCVLCVSVPPDVRGLCEGMFFSW